MKVTWIDNRNGYMTTWLSARMLVNLAEENTKEAALRFVYHPEDKVEHLLGTTRWIFIGALSCPKDWL